MAYEALDTAAGDRSCGGCGRVAQRVTFDNNGTFDDNVILLLPFDQQELINHVFRFMHAWQYG